MSLGLDRKNTAKGRTKNVVHFFYEGKLQPIWRLSLGKEKKRKHQVIDTSGE